MTYKDEDGQEVNIDENSLQNYYGRDDCDLLYDNEDQAKQSIADFLEAKGITDDDIIAQNFDMTVQEQSSFVLMDQSTGYVLALSGGRGEKKTSRSFNRATQSTRQPGSVFRRLPFSFLLWIPVGFHWLLLRKMNLIQPLTATSRSTPMPTPIRERRLFVKPLLIP